MKHIRMIAALAAVAIFAGSASGCASSSKSEKKVSNKKKDETAETVEIMPSDTVYETPPYETEEETDVETAAETETEPQELIGPQYQSGPLKYPEENREEALRQRLELREKAIREEYGDTAVIYTSQIDLGDADECYAIRDPEGNVHFYAVRHKNGGEGEEIIRLDCPGLMGEPLFFCFDRQVHYGSDDLNTVIVFSKDGTHLYYTVAEESSDPFAWTYYNRKVVLNSSGVEYEEAADITVLDQIYILIHTLDGKALFSAWNNSFGVGGAANLRDAAITVYMSTYENVGDNDCYGVFAPYGSMLKSPIYSKPEVTDRLFCGRNTENEYTIFLPDGYSINDEPVFITLGDLLYLTFNDKTLYIADNTEDPDGIRFTRQNRLSQYAEEGHVIGYRGVGNLYVLMDDNYEYIVRI